MSNLFNRRTTQNKLLTHNKLMERISKSLYFGNDSLATELEISRPLAEYSAELFSEAHRGHSLNRLHSVAAGSLHATPCSLIMALIYLDRLHASDPGFLRRITPQELFIVSMMISTKVYVGYDELIDLRDWAKQGNINKKRLKRLELEFLSAIDWTVHVSNEQFFKKLQLVEENLARREGTKRGWLTYTELIQILPSMKLAKILINHFTLLAVSYTAGIATLTSAMLLANQISNLDKLRLTTLKMNQSVETQTMQESVLIDMEQSLQAATATPSTNILCQKEYEPALNLDINATTSLLYVLKLLQPVEYAADMRKHANNNESYLMWQWNTYFDKQFLDYASFKSNFPIKSVS